MAHIESAEQAIERIENAAIVRDRTIFKANGDGQRISRAEFHYLSRIRNARKQVRYNAGINDLEQGVLGTTGSPKELEKFKALARQLGEQAGEPIVEVQEVRAGGEGVSRALVGEIDGSLHTWANFLHISPRSIPYPRQVATLQLAASRLTLFSLEEGEWHINSSKETRVRTAEISLDEVPNSKIDPERDYRVYDHREEGLVLIGEEAIRGSGLFEPDLKFILELAGTPV